jgi:hypothetical protein
VDVVFLSLLFRAVEKWHDAIFLLATAKIAIN